MNISTLSSKNKKKFIDITNMEDCKRVFKELEETIKKTYDAGERIDTFYAFLSDCDKISNFMEAKKITGYRDMQFNNKLRTSSLKKVPDFEKARKKELNERALNFCAKSVALISLNDAKMFTDLLKEGTARKERALLIPYCNNLDDFEKELKKFETASSEERTNMLADKLNKVKEVVIKLFSAKNEEELLSIAEENILLISALGEFDQYLDNEKHLKEAYGITLTEDMKNVMAFLKDNAVTAGMYQAYIGMMADPLYTEFDHVEDLHDYAEFIAYSDVFNDIFAEYEDAPKLSNIAFGSEVNSFINGDIAVHHTPQNHQNILEACLNIYKEVNKIENPIYFDANGKKIDINTVRENLLKNEEVRILGNGKIRSFKYNNKLTTLNNLVSDKEVQKIDIYGATKEETTNYLRNLKNILNDENPLYMKVRSFFAAREYSKLIDSVNKAIKEYDSNDAKKNMDLLSDVKNKAIAYLDYKNPKNDVSDLATGRTNAVLNVLEQINATITYSYPDYEKNNELADDVSVIDLQTVGRQAIEIEVEMDDVEIPEENEYIKEDEKTLDNNKNNESQEDSLENNEL